MTTTSETVFLSAFQMRRDHCRALWELSRLQLNLIAEDDYTKLIDVISHKQRLLGSLGALSRSRPELWNDWRTRRDQLDSETRKKCDDLLDESERFLAEVLKQEEEGTNALTRRRDETHRQLNGLTQGSHVRNAYDNCLAPTTNRHLDIDL